MAMRQFDAQREIGIAEIQSGKGARIGLIAKADIHRIRAVFDRGLERWQVSGGADEEHGGLIVTETVVAS